MDEVNNNTTPLPQDEELNRGFENDMDQMPSPPRLQPRLVNGIPISYAIDGSDDDAISKMIDQNTEGDDFEPTPEPPVEKPRARRARSAPAPKVEEPVETPVRDAPKATPRVAPAPVPAQAPVAPEAPIEAPAASGPKASKTLSGANAINLFKQAVGAGLIPVKIYSTDEEILMRELTVTDQKTLSKTALINNNRRDVLYTAQNSLINSCVKAKDFDIRNYTEFDRIIILLRLYQQNYFTNDIHYTCAECGKENVYKLDFTKMLERVQKAWTRDKVFTMKHLDKEFHFTVGWPSVAAVTEFYNSYYKQYQKFNEKTQNTIDQLSNVEYLVMFIRKIELFSEGLTEGVALNLDDYSYAERTDLIDSLPQGLIFDDDQGIISTVIAEFTDPLNKAFRYEKCQFCGAETEEGIGSIADFT